MTAAPPITTTTQLVGSKVERRPGWSKNRGGGEAKQPNSWQTAWRESLESFLENMGGRGMAPHQRRGCGSNQELQDGEGRGGLMRSRAVGWGGVAVQMEDDTDKDVGREPAPTPSITL